MKKPKERRITGIVQTQYFAFSITKERSLTLLMQNQKQGKSGLRVNFIKGLIESVLMGELLKR
ncbi:hypothetical protein, partial [Anaerophaga thermohalophila]|uniref:hypothetical protein n=1 Tax=Anaerophaga thermohalophila TaxID=177400 RepID=UPI001C400AFE